MLTRAVNFAHRWNWLSSLTGGRARALAFLIRARGDRLAQGRAFYDSEEFAFRGSDLSALKEVLIDREYDFLADFLKTRENPLILDAGAHIGTFALWALGQNPRARVLSVEADPATFAILSRNRAGHETWQCVNRAAWKNEDMISFSDAGDSMSHRVSESGSVAVQGATLPALLEKLGGRADLLKVDIEGAEENFLGAFPDALQKVDALVVELHPNLCDAAKTRGLLDKYFNDIKEIQSRTSSKPLLFCRR